MSQNDSQLLHETDVAAMFDEMAAEYDDITDLWYSWLFCRLHHFLVLDLARSGIGTGHRCLDVGCGTGFQSILLNLCGHNVVGVDIASVLLEQAKHKKAERYLTQDLFNAPFPFVPKYSRQVREIAERYRDGSRLGQSEFCLTSATKLPFAGRSFDVVNCCGSTLNFIDDYSTAIREMVRVLKPGGFLFLEVESKYNADLLWPVLDTKLFRGRIGFDQPNDGIMRNLLSPRREHVKITYPFSGKAQTIEMPMWLFSSARLLADLEAAGIVTNRIHAIHAITNLLPSVILDDASPSPWLMRVFRTLSVIEEAVSTWPVVRRLGCSLVLAGTKK